MSAVKAALTALAAALLATAHVGSPDVFFQGSAGPYPMLVTIRPADVVPGIAHIQIRSLSDGLNEVQLTPTPMVGEASKHPPAADIASRSAADPKVFDGTLWLMTMGAWVVHIHASGSAGPGDLAVPVPAVARRIAPMDSFTTYFLAAMMVFLVVGMVAIVGAGVRESVTEPGAATRRWTPRTTGGVLLSAIVLLLALWGGNAWWSSDAAFFQRRIYQPLRISASVDPSGRADFHLTDPGWVALRKLDDLIPDHGHMMHLFLVRWPAMDEVFHLHPDPAATGFFSLKLPSLPAGQYKVFADIVHENGLEETAVGDADLPDIRTAPPSGDDSGGPATTDLGGGYRMVWQGRPSGAIAAKDVNLFSFGIAGPDGAPVSDLEPYMGMGGHAEFVKRDGSVFAHVHPTGSVSMASVAVASPAEMAAMHQVRLGSVVSFPYGVPSPGSYRIFVQLKRAGKVETGTFDLDAK